LSGRGGGLLSLGARGEAPAASHPALAAAVLAGLLSLLIGAPLVLPLLDALPQTAIHQARRVSVATQGRGQSVAAGEAARRLLPAALPFAHGVYGRSPVQGWRRDGSGMPLAYSGATLFPLALLGIRSRRRGRGLFLALYLAGLGYGASAPVLLDLTSAIPGFDVALNYRMVFLAPLGLAGLAAFGADELSQGARRPFLFAVAGSLALLLLLFALSGDLFRARELSRVFVWTSLAVEVLPLVLLAGAAAPRRVAGGSLAGLALLLLAGQRHLEMGGIYPTLPAGALAPALPTLGSLPRTVTPYRIVAAQDVFRPNGATLYGLEDVRGYEPFTLAELAEVFPLWCRPQHAAHTRVEDLTRPFLAFLNARFAIAPPDGAVPPGWRELSRGKEMALFENPRALERAFAPRRVRYEQDPKSRLEQMAQETDFSERVWISEDEGVAGEEIQNGTAQLLVRSAGPELHITANVSSRALVATSLPAWPGWAAATPQGRLTILRVNHAFVGFWIGPGRHEVRLRYRPPTLNAAFAACLAGILLVIALGAFAAIRKNGRDPTVIPRPKAEGSGGLSK
jgi:hypothetical protein